MGGNTVSGQVSAASDAPGAPPAAAKTDNLEQLEATYRQHLDKVLRVCRAMLRDEMDAEDAAQETFMRFARRAGQLTDDPAPYLAAVARNVCRDELKRRVQRDAAVPDAPAPESIENRYLSIALTRSVWNRLNGRDRQLFAHVFAGYRYHETAARTGLSPQAVSVGLTRARQRARKALGAVSSVLLPLPQLRSWFEARRREVLDGRPLALEAWQAMVLRTTVAGLVVGGTLSMLPGAAGVPQGQVRSTEARPVVGDTAMVASEVAIGGEHQAPVPPAAPAVVPVPAVPAAALVNAVVTPSNGARPEDAQFTSFTPSPTYARDRTVYASGQLNRGCNGYATCPVVFRSNDGGGSWRALGSQGFSGGQVLLPPDPRRDLTLFAIGPAGLQQSNDDGATFITVVPGIAAAAVVPDSPVGGTRVLVGSSPMAVYDARARTMSAGPSLPVGTLPPAQLAYAGGSNRIVATATRVSPTSSTLQEGVVLGCGRDGQCAVALALGESGSIQVAVSPTYAADHTVLAYSQSRVYVSRDGGTSYAPLGADFKNALRSLAPAPDLAASHRLIAGSESVSVAGASLSSLAEDGTSSRPLGQSGLPMGSAIRAVAALEDGRLLVAVYPGPGARAAVASDFGMRCSADGGSTWRPSC